jgi:hypothetical protein
VSDCGSLRKEAFTVVVLPVLFLFPPANRHFFRSHIGVQADDKGRKREKGCKAQKKGQTIKFLHSSLFFAHATSPRTRTRPLSSARRHKKELLKLDHILPLPTKPCRSFSFALDFSLSPPSVSSLEYGPTADRFFEFQPSSSTSRYSPKPTGKTRIDALEHILVIWDHLRRALFIVDSTRTAHRKAFPASTASFVQRTP